MYQEGERFCQIMTNELAIEINAYTQMQYVTARKSELKAPLKISRFFLLFGETRIILLRLFLWFCGVLDDEDFFWSYEDKIVSALL